MQYYSIVKLLSVAGCAMILFQLCHYINCLLTYLLIQSYLHSTPLTGRAIKPQRQGHIGGPIAQPWGGEVGMSVCMHDV